MNVAGINLQILLTEYECRMSIIDWIDVPRKKLSPYVEEHYVAVWLHLLFLENNLSSILNAKNSTLDSLTPLVPC